jgi:hypothetical protein
MDVREQVRTWIVGGSWNMSMLPRWKEDWTVKSGGGASKQTGVDAEKGILDDRQGG